MIPLMEKELVDRHHWLTNEEFMDIIAYNPKCNGALDYTALWDEMCGIMEKSDKGNE